MTEVTLSLLCRKLLDPRIPPGIPTALEGSRGAALAPDCGHCQRGDPVMGREGIWGCCQASEPWGLLGLALADEGSV